MPTYAGAGRSAATRSGERMKTSAIDMEMRVDWWWAGLLRFDGRADGPGA